MHNYHIETIWAVNMALLYIVALTCVVIMLTTVVKNFLWERRRIGLIKIKKDVYEFVLSHKSGSPVVCPSFIDDVTPQQFIDIKTNRRIDAAFFNESEQELLEHCFVKPDDIKKLEKAARQSGNKWRQIEAILCLGYTQTGSAVDVIKKNLSSKDPDISYFSIISLGQIKTEHSAKALLNFLKKDPSNCYKIVSVLETFPKDIADDVVKLIDYHDPLIRLWSLKLLSKFATRDHMRKLEKLTEDIIPEVRAAACDCLGAAGSVEARGTLIKCLKDDNWLVRSRAIYALGRVLKDAAIPEIMALINDASWMVLDALKVVMSQHITASLPYIEKFLDGDYEIAKKYSVLALQDSGHLEKLLKEAIAGRSAAIKVLKSVVRSKFHSGLDTALARLDPAAREKALEVIMKD